MEGAQHADGTEELGHQVLVAAAHTECVHACMLVCVCMHAYLCVCTHGWVELHGTCTDLLTYMSAGLGIKLHCRLLMKA